MRIKISGCKCLVLHYKFAKGQRGGNTRNMVFVNGPLSYVQ